MRWTVRRAHEDDAAELARVNVASWRQAYAGIVDASYLNAMDIGTHASRWAERLRRPIATDAVFVAETTDSYRRLAAYCLVRFPERDQADSGVGRMVALYADPAWWGWGAGSAVHRAAVDHLIRRGCGAAVLWVAAENDRARGFYVRHGWCDESHLPDAREDYLVADQTIQIVRYRNPLT